MSSSCVLLVLLPRCTVQCEWEMADSGEPKPDPTVKINLLARTSPRAG